MVVTSYCLSFTVNKSANTYTNYNKHPIGMSNDANIDLGVRRAESCNPAS